jgi:hypothetical protein
MEGLGPSLRFGTQGCKIANREPLPGPLNWISDPGLRSNLEGPGDLPFWILKGFPHSCVLWGWASFARSHAAAVP